MPKPFYIDDMYYDDAASKALRQNLIVQRDKALAASDWELTISLTHAIAWMDHFMQLEIPHESTVNS